MLCMGMLLLTLGSAEARTAPKSTSQSAAKKASARKGKSAGKKVKGQAAPDSNRTREIQAALIREHYLNGEPSGSWDNDTRTALTKYQADHGWQTKIVPDSRALIKLGLGPSRDNLLNPDTAAVSPHELGGDKSQPGGATSN